MNKNFSLPSLSSNSNPKSPLPGGFQREVNSSTKNPLSTVSTFNTTLKNFNPRGGGLSYVGSSPDLHKGP
jgi:hypothetical protein